MNKYNLNNKIAIVTGGSRGIGKGIVKKLLESGAKVALLGRTDKLSEAAYQEGKDLRIPTYREMEDEIDFPMKLDSSTKHFICKRCGLYATREQISDIRYKLSRKESTRADKQYDYLDWWQKSKKEKEAQ